MKRAIFILAILLASTLLIKAQSIYDIRNAIDFFESNKIHTGDYNTELTESDIKGSPFLNDEFISGTIYTYQKVQFNQIPLRYNIYNGNLEFRTPQEQVMAMATPEIVKKAVFGEYTLSYIPFMTSKKVRQGFFKLIEEGKASLYARPIILYQQPKEAAAYKDPAPAKFIQKPDDYFIRIGQEAAIKVENKKEVILLFPDHKDEITSFIKKNKIKTGKVENLQELVRYYNTF